VHMDQIMAEGGLFLGIEWPILWQKVADDMAVFSYSHEAKIAVIFLAIRVISRSCEIIFAFYDDVVKKRVLLIHEDKINNEYSLYNPFYDGEKQYEKPSGDMSSP